MKPCRLVCCTGPVSSLSPKRSLYACNACALLGRSSTCDTVWLPQLRHPSIQPRGASSPGRALQILGTCLHITSHTSSALPLIGRTPQAHNAEASTNTGKKRWATQLNTTLTSSCRGRISYQAHLRRNSSRQTLSSLFSWYGHQKAAHQTQLAENWTDV